MPDRLQESFGEGKVSPRWKDFLTGHARGNLFRSRIFLPSLSLQEFPPDFFYFSETEKILETRRNSELKPGKETLPHFQLSLQLLRRDDQLLRLDAEPAGQSRRRALRAPLHAQRTQVAHLEERKVPGKPNSVACHSYS